MHAEEVACQKLILGKFPLNVLKKSRQCKIQQNEKRMGNNTYPAPSPDSRCKSSEEAVPATPSTHEAKGEAERAFLAGLTRKIAKYSHSTRSRAQARCRVRRDNDGRRRPLPARLVMPLPTEGTAEAESKGEEAEEAARSGGISSTTEQGYTCAT
jgi:hypothetical protein